MSRCVKHDWHGSQGGTYGVPVPPCPWCMQGKLRERIAELEKLVDTCVARIVALSGVEQELVEKQLAALLGGGEK